MEQCECEACLAPRSKPGVSPSRLEPGQREYRGYGEWAVHPDEACFILTRGYAIVDGQRQRVTFTHNEAYVSQLKVDGTNHEERPPDRYEPVVGR